MNGHDTELIVALAASLVAWGLVSARLGRIDVSAPMFFVVVGLVLANWPVSAFDFDVHSETLRRLAELTLALLLFSDAARINARVLQDDRGLPLRLLLVGLPLTIAIGTALAIVLFSGLDPWAAAIIAAAVAPTDAALGAQVVEDRNVPMRIRRALNVESGLNDGIATPFVTFFIAGAVADAASRSSVSLADSIGDLAIGVLVGIAVGLGGGLLLKVASGRGWASPAYRGICALALAVAAYAVAIELGGNGFIGAFVGGLAFGPASPEPDHEAALEFDAQTGELLSLVVWFLFGVALVPALDGATWQTLAFVILALTVARMVPVALALVGSGLSPVAVAFMGWFGPRGLASVVFALIAFDALEGPDSQTVLSAIALTVLVSVVAHGLTAQPLSRRFGTRVASFPATAPERRAVASLGGRRHTQQGRSERPADP